MLADGKQHHKSKTILGGVLAALTPLVYYVIVTYVGDAKLAQLVSSVLVAIGGAVGSVGVREAIGKR